MELRRHIEALPWATTRVDAEKRTISVIKVPDSVEADVHEQASLALGVAAGRLGAAHR
ncbi:MAG: hypothetical protein HYS12_06225 [Planctomycetes bacterium]|nr:hypothetical protein [Planctomycetota bacterium]